MLDLVLAAEIAYGVTIGGSPRIDLVQFILNSMLNRLPFLYQRAVLTRVP
jgi:hypothetical protein